MEINTLIITVVVALLAAAIGYLVANTRSAKQYVQLELKNTKLTSELEHAQSNHDELEADIAELENDLLQVREDKQGAIVEKQKEENAKIDAESTNRALRVQVGDLQERLNKAELQTKEERAQAATLKDLNSDLGKEHKASDTSLREARTQLAQAKEELIKEKQDFSELNARYQSQSTEFAELKTSLESKEEHFEERLKELNEAKVTLTKEFENVANKIFEEKGKTFSHTSQVSIDNMLKPFREQIDGFQKRVNEVHDESVKGNTYLNAEIKKVLDIGMQMSKEATNLTSALKGDSQQRGAWGEAQLRRTLEMSGLVEDTHYEVQSSFKDAEGRQKQTDYLIKLPDEKHIIIDSKVSLNAYDRAVGAESPEEYTLAMAEHVKAVRNHIDDLASKDYTNLIGMHSPSFVLMFMPIEPAYIEALKSNKDLFEYGYKKGIVLVSHTTLIPILRTVSNLWMIERSNADARQLSEKAGDIYNSVCSVAERLQKLGNTLGTVSNHYNSTVKALAGQQGLYGKVERFSEVSAKVNKTLTKLEPTHLDFETERLSLIAEPVPETETETQSIANESSTIEIEPIQSDSI